MNVRHPRQGLLALTLALFSMATTAQVSVKDPWVRGTVAQQKASGAFMQITSAAGGRLVGASSPVAGVVEIHEMAMDGNVMKMRAIPGLTLPAGQPVELKPGGFHVMLMDLKQALQPGQTVPITLVIEGAGGQRETVQVSASVRALNQGAAPMQHRH
jgi:copper(I)-binding protein